MRLGWKNGETIYFLGRHQASRVSWSLSGLLSVGAPPSETGLGT